MGSKGSQTVQQSGNQSQTYMPNPQGYGAISGALQQAQNVAQTPFSTPQAPVAGFSPQQQQAFDITGQTQGYAQPYIDQASHYFSPQGTQDFLNPYTANVSANLQDIFGQQMSQTTGQLTQAAGGVGADRIGVGQSELAKQQGLSAGQTFAGLYGNAAQQAQTAGFGTANLGTAGQNAQLQGAQALLGTGGLQQQLQQAQMNSPYQQQLQQIAWPYQNAQFLAGITGSLAPGLGGTTTGVNGNGTTYPGASPWGTIAGLGLTGLGVYGMGQKQGWWGGGGSNPSDTMGPSDPEAMPAQARGGRINPYRGYAGGGATDDDSAPASDSALRMLEANQLEASGRNDPGGGPIQLPSGVNGRPIDGTPQSLIPEQKLNPIQPHMPQLTPPPGPQQQSAGGKGSGMGDVASAAMKILPMVLALKRGGAVHDSREEIRHDDARRQWDDRRDDIDQDWVDTPGSRAFNTRGFGPPILPGSRMVDPEGMSRDVRRIARGGSVNPYFADGGAPDSFDDRWMPPQAQADPARYNQLQDYGASLPGYGDTGRAEPHMAGIPLPRPRPGDEIDVADDDETPESATPTAGTRPPGGADDLAPAAPDRPNRSHGFIDSPWAAVLSAGLGTLAAAGTRDARGLPTPPLAAIGQGGMHGLKTLEDQRTASQKQMGIEQEARKLDQAAQFHRDEFTKMKPYQKAQIEVAKQRYGSGLFNEETVDMMAHQALSGDKSVFSNLGRGTSGPQNIVQVRQRMNELARERGIKGNDLAAINANFNAQSAAARTTAVREANVSTAIEEARRTFPLALEASAAVPRGQFVPWNKLQQMVREQTSSPQQAAYAVALQGAITAYSQAMSRTGINTVHAQQRAEKALSGVTSHAALEAELHQMDQEMQAAERAPDVVRQAILARISGGANSPLATPPPSAAPAAGAPAAAAPAAAPAVAPRRKQNGFVYEQQKDGSWSPVQ